MADQDTAALAWAQANSKDPRAQDVMAKAWAAQNPSDPRASAILQRFSATPINQNVAHIDQKLAPSFYPGAFGRAAAGPSAPGEADSKALKDKMLSLLPLLGGLAGTAVGPEGTGVGAWLGSAAAGALGAGTGSAAKNLISNDPAGPKEALKQVGSDALFQGALPEIGGRAAGALASKAVNFIKPAVARAGMMDLAKNEAAAGPAFAQKLDQSEELFNKSQIKPRMESQKAILETSGKPIMVNPDEFRNISPELDEMANKLHRRRFQMTNDLPEHTPGGPNSMVPATPEEALELRRLANNKAGFYPAEPYGPEARAREQSAKLAGDSIRQNFASIDPKLPELSDELQQKYALKQDVFNKSDKTPIATVTGTNADKVSKLAQIDADTGMTGQTQSLRQMGKDYDLARDRLGQNRSINTFESMKPGIVKWVDKGLGYAPRAYDATAQAISPGMEALSKFLGSPAGKQTAKGVLGGIPVFSGRNKE